MTIHMWRDLFLCDMSHLYMATDKWPFISTRLIHMWQHSSIYTRHMMLLRWLILMCDMTHSYAWSKYLHALCIHKSPAIPEKIYAVSKKLYEIPKEAYPIFGSPITYVSPAFTRCLPLSEPPPPSLSIHTHTHSHFVTQTSDVRART